MADRKLMRIKVGDPLWESAHDRQKRIGNELDQKFTDKMELWGRYVRSYSIARGLWHHSKSAVFKDAGTKYNSGTEWLESCEQPIARAVDACVNSLFNVEQKYWHALHLHWAWNGKNQPAVWRNARIPSPLSDEFVSLLNDAHTELKQLMIKRGVL